MIKIKRILVLGTSYGGGDVPPLLALVNGLVDRGNEVLFIGDQGLIDLTHGTGLRIEPVPPELEMRQYFNRWRQTIDAASEAPMSRLFLSMAQ